MNGSVLIFTLISLCFGLQSAAWVTCDKIGPASIAWTLAIFAALGAGKLWT